MILRACLLAVAIPLFLPDIAHAADEANVDLPRFPSISPDGAQVVFSWRGDLWKVGSRGGLANRLTSHPLDEQLSAWSRDGQRIAFGSTRAGGGNLFIMNADGTGIRQVTQTDRTLSLASFGTDEQGNEVLTLAAYIDPDPFRSPRPYMVSTRGGELARLHDAFGLFPVVSPDGKRVLFNRGTSGWSRRNFRGPDTRDVWLFTRDDKAFRQLTSWPGNDGRARWVNDDEFVYSSDRHDDTVNLYRLSVGQNDAQARRLTNFKDLDVEEFDVSADGRTLVLARWNRLHTLDLSRPDAQPVELRIRAAEDESDRVQLKDVSRTITEAALSPDGKTIAYISYGDVYVRGTEARSATRRVTSKPARERDIAWAPDSQSLYFVSDETGAEAIYSASVKLTRSEVKKAYERATKKDPASKPATLPATGPGAEETATPPSGESGTDEDVEQRRRRAEPPGASPAQPTTAPRAGAPESKDEADSEPSPWAEALQFKIELITSSSLGDMEPSPSPDGKHLAFKRGKGSLFLLDLKDKSEHALLRGWSESLEWRWSPESKRIAYQTEDPNHNCDIWIVDADRVAREGAEHAPGAVNITRHPANDFSPRFSADGKILAFRSERVNSEHDVWMAYLDKDVEQLPGNELDQYYKDAADAVKKRKPLKPATQAATASTTSAATTTAATTAPAVATEELDLDDAYLRLRRITTLSGDERDLELSPAGNRFVFTAQLGTARGLFSFDRDATEPKRLGNAVSVRHLNFAGDQVVFVDAGRAGIVKLPGGEVEHYDIAERIRIDLEAQSVQKFHEASRIVGREYWDPKMNGLDWRGVTNRYLELARAARTSDEFDHVGSRLLGELNGSHLGINSPDPTNPLSRPSGRLGIDTVRVPNGYRVTGIVQDGPADRSAMRLRINDVITAIDGEPFESPTDTLDAKLAGKVDREVLVTFTRNGTELAALLTTISYDRWNDLTYNQWRRDNARKVDEWSGGRIGYIHILAMSQTSLDVYVRDLYAAANGKQGLIVDVRNNGGGSTADRLLASIMYSRHAYTIPRDMDPSIKTAYPQDRLFIPPFTGAMSMLCNEKSFSNAEIIAHAFKTLKRGTLVGQQTAGGVISTGGTMLLDGTSVRLPGRAWFLPDGSNMERNGAKPDLLVPQKPEDEVKGDDAQLRAAVDELLTRIK
jgi:tricorn protease